MELLKSLRLSLKLLAISELDGRPGYRIYVFILLYATLSVNLTCFVADRWFSMDERINALKALVFLTPFMVYCISFIWFWDEFSKLLIMFHHPYFNFPYRVTSERKSLIHSLQSEMTSLNRFWIIMIVAYAVSNIVIPLIVISIKILYHSVHLYKIIQENKSLPFPLYYPENKFGFLNEVNIFMIGYALHSLFTIYAAIYAHLCNVTALNAMTVLEYELVLLRLSIEEMEQHCDSPKMEYKTKLFLRYIVQHHQSIYSKYNDINQGIRWIASTISTGASVYICMSIYTIVQKDQLVLKLQEAVFLAVWAYDIYMYDAGGEKVRTQDGNLRDALYACLWYKKPKWFKSSLLIVLTRTSRTMDIKPFRLFALNFKSFALTMNAAYSYYNLLHKFNTP